VPNLFARALNFLIFGSLPLGTAVLGHPAPCPPVGESPYEQISHQENTAMAVVAFDGNLFISINGELDMLDRPKLSKTRVIKEAAPNVPIGQGKPSLQQFQLKVDGQTKDSFATFETAEKAGVKIKTAHPVVQVSVYDSVKAAKTIISA
jgi:hypothetical protein